MLISTMKLMKQSDITEACVRILKQWNARAGAIVFSEIPKARGRWLSHARDMVSAGAWLQWGYAGMKGRQYEGLSLLWYGQSHFILLSKCSVNTFSTLFLSSNQIGCYSPIPYQAILALTLLSLERRAKGPAGWLTPAALDVLIFSVPAMWEKEKGKPARRNGEAEMAGQTVSQAPGKELQKRKRFMKAPS